jgi:hypothetical protein
MLILQCSRAKDFGESQHILKPSFIKYKAFNQLWGQTVFILIFLQIKGVIRKLFCVKESILRRFKTADQSKAGRYCSKPQKVIL